MIINHTHKFIFIKTRKTAGTSIEIALSQFCGPDDCITPITEKDEQIRRAAGFRGPQNYTIPLRFYTMRDWRKCLHHRNRKLFFNHAPAAFVKKYIGQDIWGSYFKFCFERDPFDKAISRYYWSTHEPRPKISDYLTSAPVKSVSNWDTYAINERIAVDYVGRYENLTEDLATIARRIGLPETISLPRAKGEFRKDRKHYSEILNTRARDHIEQVCAREIAAFNYPWHTPQPV